MEDTAESEDLPTDSSVQRVIQSSRLGQLGRWLTDAVRDSYLYRWLTAEPDPDVIVIDLRETWTVGPFIRLLDAIIDRLVPALKDSRAAGAVQKTTIITHQQPAVVAGLGLLIAGVILGLASVAGGTLGTTRLVITAVALITGALATRERRNWSALRETRPVALLIAALEPPEPPEENTPHDDPDNDK